MYTFTQIIQHNYTGQFKKYKNMNLFQLNNAKFRDINVSLVDQTSYQLLSHEPFQT